MRDPQHSTSISSEAADLDTLFVVRIGMLDKLIELLGSAATRRLFSGEWISELARAYERVELPNGDINRPAWERYIDGLCDGVLERGKIEAQVRDLARQEAAVSSEIARRTTPAALRAAVRADLGAGLDACLDLLDQREN